MKTFYTFVLFFTSVCISKAQYVDFDLTYGTDGFCSPMINGINDVSRAFAVNGTGKALHVGYSETVDGMDYCMTRVLSTGAADNVYGLNGSNTVDGGSFLEAAEDIELYSNGKALICGSYYDANYANTGCTIMRATSNGNLDATFSTDGGDFLNGGDGENYEAVACLILPDQRVLVLCNYSGYLGYYPVLFRYEANGTFDDTFGSTGMLLLDAAGEFCLVHDMILGDDGNVLICGYSDQQGAGVIFKMDSDGQLISDFAGNGVAYLESPMIGSTTLWDMVLQDDGKIVSSGSYGSNKGVIARFNADGALDVSFSTDGIAKYSFDTFMSAFLTEVSIDPNNKIVAAGYGVYTDDSEDALMMRFTSAGELDNTFAATDYYIPNFEGSKVRITGLEILNTGKIMTTGYSTDMQETQGIILGARFITGDVIAVQENQMTELEVYPNPANSNLTIRLRGHEERGSIVIMESSGRIVRSEQINQNTGQLDISALSAGVYIVEIHSGDSMRRYPLIKE